MSTELFLVKHGTKAFRLPPSAIVSTALADLALLARKKDGAEHEARDTELMGRRYAFLGKHVRKPKTAADLLKLALEDEAEWLHSTKPNVAIIYGDKATLQDALALASTAPTADPQATA